VNYLFMHFGLGVHIVSTLLPDAAFQLSYRAHNIHPGFQIWSYYNKTLAVFQA